MESTGAEWEGREMFTNFHNLRKNGWTTKSKVFPSVLRSTNPMIKYTTALIQTETFKNKGSELSSSLLLIPKLLTIYGDASSTSGFSE